MWRRPLVVEEVVGWKRQLLILLLVWMLRCLILGGRFSLDKSTRAGANDGHVGRRGRIPLSNLARHGVIDAHGGGGGIPCGVMEVWPIAWTEAILGSWDTQESQRSEVVFCVPGRGIEGFPSG